jgi:hypothetical protein
MKLLVIAAALFVASVATTRIMRQTDVQLRQVGSIETVTEVESGIEFSARIDTGATSCSIHCESMEIINREPRAEDNVGRRIRFLVKNKHGDSKWLESVIADHVMVRNSERSDDRYKVPLTLRCRGVEKTVLVTLNDRQSMRYPVLIGRNFLRDEFVVNVRLDGEI